MKGVTNLNRKTILMLLNQKFSPDIRVEQEYRALVEAGYRVIIIANNEGSDDDSYEIIRIKSLSNNLAKIKSNLRIKSKRLLNEIITQLDRIDIDIVDYIHVHDLKWSYLGFELKEHYDAKVIIDLHENYPAYISDIKNQNSRFSIKNAIKYFGLNYKALVKYERSTLEECDAFITVVKEALERFRGTSFYHKGRVVSNTKDVTAYSFFKVPELNSEINITYVGTIQKLRGIETAIRGMVYLDKKFKLNIVGIRKKQSYSRELIKLKEKFSLDNVNLIEWIDEPNKVDEIIRNSHICIVPHDNSELTQTTIPHKLFIYMCMGRPVLASDVKPLKRIVEETRSGLVFKANSPKDFSKKVIMMNDYKSLSGWGYNARIGAENVFNWEVDKKQLLQIYEDLNN